MVCHRPRRLLCPTPNELLPLPSAAAPLLSEWTLEECRVQNRVWQLAKTCLKRPGRRKRGGITEAADLRSQKPSFEVLETFVCSVPLHSRAAIKAKRAGSSADNISPPPHPFFCPLFCFHSLLLALREHLCQRWKALYLLHLLWCLNDGVRNKLFSGTPPHPPTTPSQDVSLEIPAVASAFPKLLLKNKRAGCRRIGNNKTAGVEKPYLSRNASAHPTTGFVVDPRLINPVFAALYYVSTR